MDEIRYADNGVAPEDGGWPNRLEISHEGGFSGPELPLGLGQLRDATGTGYLDGYSFAGYGGDSLAGWGGDSFAGYEEFAAERSFARLSARPWSRSWRGE